MFRRSLSNNWLDVVIIMDLEIEIIPVEKFEVKIKGKSIGEFEKKTSWEGLVKMQSDKGIIIASDDRNIMEKMFDGLSDAEKQSRFSVVKITPSLIPMNN